MLKTFHTFVYVWWQHYFLDNPNLHWTEVWKWAGFPLAVEKTGNPGKMRVFPVRKKSRNIKSLPESQGKVREIWVSWGKSGKIISENNKKKFHKGSQKQLFLVIFIFKTGFHILKNVSVHWLFGGQRCLKTFTNRYIFSNKKKVHWQYIQYKLKFFINNLTTVQKQSILTAEVPQQTVINHYLIAINDNIRPDHNQLEYWVTCFKKLLKQTLRLWFLSNNCGIPLRELF